MSTHDGRELWARWADLWNGDLAQAEAIISPDFTLHMVAPYVNADDVRGREGLAGWIEITRSMFDDLRFTTEVGPIVDGDTIAGRWIAEGTYRGGFPGSTAPPGTRMTFHGNDILRAQDGLIRNYWLSSDGLDLMQQLGVVASD